MNVKSKKHYLFSKEFPYLRTDITNAIKLLKESLNKYDVILLTGPKGSGKGVFLNEFFAIDENYSFVNNDYITAGTNQSSKGNDVIVWPNIEEYNLISDSSIEESIITNLENFGNNSVKTIGTIQKYNLDARKQLFQARESIRSSDMLKEGCTYQF